MTKENAPTPEELASEQQALADVKEEDIRAEIINEFGFDETADKDKIDKATKREIDNRKKLSSAIGQKIKHRTEKEELAKKLNGEVIPPKKKEGEDDDEGSKNNLSTKDTIAIMNAKVHEEDIDEVVEYATFKKISVADALKSSVVKATLAERAEARKSAEATQTRTTPRANAKLSDDEIVKKAQKGEIPEPKSKEAEDLFWARRGGKR